jgi:serine/threonine protein kinase
MGVVYRARHKRLGKVAAVKIMARHAEESAFARRFLQEAKVLAELRHPGIVGIHDFDIADDGIPWYVMDFLEGSSLATCLQRNSQGLSHEQAGRIVHELGTALEHAHSAGVVHRDLKPDNVFLAREGAAVQVKLLDFGIAKRVEETDGEASSLTGTGMMVGTPMYLAPEQINGMATGPFTDQYALALLLFEMIEGRPARLGQTLSQIAQTAAVGPLDLSGCDRMTPLLHRALARATAPSAAARFPSVGAFVDACSLPRSDSLLDLLAEPAIGSVVEPKTPSTLIDPGASDGNRPSDRPVSDASTTPAPVSVIRSLAAPVSRRRRLVMGAALATPLVLALILFAVHWVNGSRSAAVPDVLQLDARLPVPADASALMALTRDAAVLRAGRGWYVQPLDPAGGVGARIPLTAGEVLIGALEGGHLAVASDTRIEIRSAAGEALRSVAGLEGLAARLPDKSGRPSLWISPDATHLLSRTVAGLHLYRLDDGRWSELVQFPLPGDELLSARLSRTHAVIAANSSGRLSALSLADGRTLWSREIKDGNVLAIHIADDARRLGLAGWTGAMHVLELHTGNPLAQFEARGEIAALTHVPGVDVWISAAPAGIRSGSPAGLPAGWPGQIEGAFAGIAFAHGRMATLDTGNSILRLYSVHTLDGAVQRRDAGGDEVWALARSADGSVFAGGREGRLYQYRGAKSRAFDLHDDGITDLVADDAHLASASDDKTIAVWRLSDMTPVFRSRSHDYLINQLHLSGAGSGLWSSSSDGMVKRWSWPGLEERDAIDVRALTGQRHSLHALWVSGDQRSALVGTWSHQLLWLQRGESEWRFTGFPVASETVYRFAHLEALDAVAIVGLNPSRLWCFDLVDGTLHPLPDHGQEWLYLAPDPGGGGFIASGFGVIGRYALERRADGFDTRLRLGYAGSVGGLSVLLGPDQSGQIVAGNDRGELIKLSAQDVSTALAP